METPMQKLIILLQEYADSTENLRVKQAYLNSICAIEDYKLVEEEKQMIIDAYNKDSISVAENGVRKGEQYYNLTFCDSNEADA